MHKTALNVQNAANRATARSGGAALVQRTSFMPAS